MVGGLRRRGLVCRAVIIRALVCVLLVKRERAPTFSQSRVSERAAAQVIAFYICFRVLRLSLVKIAALHGVSDRTIQRDWDKARMFLQYRLESSFD
jgi:hypothetical protein